MSNLQLTSDQDNRPLLRASALAWYRPEHLDDIATAHGVDSSLVAAVLTDDSARIQAIKELERMRASGELLKTLALPVMEKFITRAHAAMDDPDVSPATLTRVADTTFKMAGLAEERASRLRREDSQPQRVVNYFVGKAADAPPSTGEPGELIFHIIYPESAADTEKVIDAEVVSDDDTA